MSGRLRLPLALVLLAVMAVAALLIFLSTEEAKAPEATPSTGESQTQADSQVQAAALTEAQAPAATAQNVADGFQDRLVTGATGATALAFTPDDRLLVTDRRGFVRVHKPGKSGTTLAMDISNKVCSNSERGLLGIAVDPNFETASTKYVYLYYSFNKHNVCPEHQPARNDNPVNRVSRFVMNGDTIVGNSENVLVDNIPSPNGNHNAGDLRFGKDDKLYVSTGDGACDYAEPNNCQPENDASRDRHILLGKILRINPDGSIPQDNPFTGPNSGRCAETGRTAVGDSCQETFAWGFRNPFRFAMDPDAQGVSLRVNDVGGARIEEVSEVRSGGDYGWNCREGSLVLNTSNPCPGNEMVGPIHQYSHNTGCSSITGGAFVPNGARWPDFYNDVYLYGDYVCNKIFKLKPNGNGGFERTVFASNLSEGGPVSMAFGSDGSLYYTTYAGGGQVRRIAYVAGNKAPTADLKADRTYGPTPLTVNFDGSGSTDPENDTLTYGWDFTSDGTVDATGATVSHAYDAQGTEDTATLTVNDGKGNSDTATVKVYPGDTAPPEPVIESPTPEKTFKVGEQITLSGSATDADGQNVTLEWEVIRHHTAPNGHTHPFKQGTGSNLTFTAPGPEDMRSMDPQGNYLEIRLTATDSQGLSKTVSQRLDPKVTYVRFATRPAEFHLFLGNTKFRAPRTFASWEGANLNVYAPAQTRDGRRYVFRSWSDGRGNRHTIVTPAEPKKYTAAFRQR